MTRLLPLVLLVCLGIGCGSSGSCPHGAELVLRAVPQHGEPVTAQGMQLARETISGRLQSGVSSPSVSVRGSDEIVVDSAGKFVPKYLPNLASVTGSLQIFDFEKDLAPPTVANGNPRPYPTLYSLLRAVDGAAGRGTPEAYYLFDGSARHRVLQGPAGTTHALVRVYGGKMPAGARILPVPANREVVSGTVLNFTASTRPVKTSPDGTYWYLFKLPPEITGKDIPAASVGAGNGADGQPEVSLGFTPEGAKQFREITKAEYERGLLLSGLHSAGGRFNQLYAQHNAIVLDNRLQATPSIDYTDDTLSRGITVPGVTIQDLGSRQYANRIALEIQTASLMYRFVQVSSAPGCARR